MFYLVKFTNNLFSRTSYFYSLYKICYKDTLKLKRDKILKVLVRIKRIRLEGIIQEK